MEDAKLEAYYNEMKAAAPKGKRGGLGSLKGPKGQKFKGDKSYDSSAIRAGSNGLYSMFVKEGQSGYSAFDGTKKVVVDDRVGLIPCFAKDIRYAAKKREKLAVTASLVAVADGPVPLAVWQQHCSAVIKGATTKTMGIKALRNAVMKRVLAADVSLKKKAVKAAWPDTIAGLGTVLGPSYVVDEKSVSLAEKKKDDGNADTTPSSASKKRKRDENKAVVSESTSSSTSRKKKTSNSKLSVKTVAGDKTYKWKKRATDVLGETKGGKMKEKALKKEVVRRILGGKKRKEGVRLAGSEEAWTTVVREAAEIKVTANALGAKFEKLGPFIRLKK